MSGNGYDVGFATGEALAAIANQQKNNGNDPKQMDFNIDLDFSQVDKDKNKPNQGKLFLENDNGIDPGFHVDDGGVVVPGPTDDVARSERRKRNESLGFVYQDRVVVEGNPGSDSASGDAPIHEPTKGLGDASVVDQINQDLQAQQQELLAQAAPAIQAGAGLTLQSGAGGLSAFGAGALSTLAIPFSTLLILLAGTQDAAAPTLDQISPEELARVQARMANAEISGDTLGGRLVFKQGADGFLRASEATTGEVVVGPDGQIVNPQLLVSLTQGYLGNIAHGDPIPGVTRLPSNVFHIGQSDVVRPEVFVQAQENNHQGDLGDILVVVPSILPDGTQVVGFMRGGFNQLVEELINLAGIGALPANTSIDEIFRLSGIELSSELGQILTTISDSVSVADFAAQVNHLSTDILPHATQIGRHEDPALPPITIDVEAKVIGSEVERPEHDPNDIRNAAPDSAGPEYGILRFIPGSEL